MNKPLSLSLHDCTRISYNIKELYPRYSSDTGYRIFRRLWVNVDRRVSLYQVIFSKLRSEK